MGKYYFMKRICSLAVASAMLMGCIPSFAAEEETAGIAETLPALYTDAEEITMVTENQEEIVKDGYTAWTETDAHYGQFPVSAINADGRFRIEYSSAAETKIILIFSDYSDGGEKSWIAVEPTEHGGDTENGFWTEYSFEACKAKWGSDDFSDLKAICVQSWGDYNGEDISARIERVYWYNKGTTAFDAGLDAKQAFYGRALSVANAPENAEYIWYRTDKKDNSGGTMIEGAIDSAYVPTELDLGMSVYCEISTEEDSILTDAVPVFASDNIIVTELYAGSAAADDDGLAAPIYMSQCGYRFNYGMISSGGHFRVTYTGGTAELCLSEWDSGKWVQIPPSDSGEENGELYAEFDYDSCAAWYGSDFSELSAIQIKLSDTSERVTSFSWNGYDTGEIMHIIPYTDSGEITGEGDQTSVGYTYLKHAGGEFDTTLVKEDGYFYLTYEGSAENGMYLSLTSYSSGDEERAKSWATVRPSSCGTISEGRYWGRFEVSDIKAAFGDNFGRWDHIGFYIDDDITVKTNGVHLYYIDGTGETVEKNPDETEWTNKTNKDGGIAFIGDSIVHNPLVNSDVGLIPDRGDWNSILGRDDCDNYGIGGETSEHILNRFYQLLDDDCNYRQIVSLFGINDIGLEANDQMVIDRVIGNYRKVLDMAAQSPKKPSDGMFVISLLPSTPATYEGTQEHIAKVNTALEELCGEYDFVTFVNCYDALLYKGDDALPGCNTTGEPHGDPKYFMPDGLHPVAEGYKAIADILNPMLGGEYSISEGVTGDAQSWDFNDGASGWTYGGDDWSNGGTSSGSMTAENGRLKVDLTMKNTDWSQGAVTNWSDTGFDISNKDMISVDIYLEKAAVDSGGGTMLARVYGTNKDDNGTVVEKTVRLSKSSEEVVTEEGKEYYRSRLNIGIEPSEKRINNLGIILIGRNSSFDGTVLIDDLAFQRRSEETAVSVSGNIDVMPDDMNEDGIIDIASGKTGSTVVFNNSGRSGRLFDGAKLAFDVKVGGEPKFTGEIKLTAVITDTCGTESEISAELDAAMFNGTDTAHIDIPVGGISSENVEYISVRAAAGDDGCGFKDTLSLSGIVLANGTAVLTSEYVDSGGSGSGGGGGGMVVYSVKLPHTWTFDSALQGWTYGKGWENDYSGAGQSSVTLKNKMMCIKVDFSKDKDKDWSQMAASYWNNLGMQLKGGNHASMEFFYDSALQDGAFNVKLYSNIGIDAAVSVDPQKTEPVTIDGKEYRKAKLEFSFAPIASSSVQDLGLCIVGVNTSYKGELYVDNLTIDKGADIYVNSTLSAEKNNSVLSVSGNKITTAAGESVDIPSQISLVDGDADENVRRVYAYLETVGESSNVLFGQQNNIQNKAGSANLSESDTYDITGDYSAVFGIDTLALCGNEYSAAACNEKYGTSFKETAAGNVEAAAYLTNKAISNGAIVTLSAHMPNFSIIGSRETAESETYAKYDFSGYSPNTLSGDTANELLPGGLYNEAFNAYLDMVADYAGMVDGAILFRPFHENTGSWFWWGKAFCDPSTYQNIFRYTVEYLRDEKDVHNLLYVYAPGSEAESTAEYEERYPGDSYVDIVGFDMYDNAPDETGTWMDQFERQLEIVTDFAAEHGKLAAVTETGAANATAEGDTQTALLKTGNKDKDWYNRLLDIIAGSSASYFMVWANFGESNGFYTPYVIRKNSDGMLYGHEMLDNFIDFYNDERSVFASDQKNALAGVQPAEASAVNSGAEGYITSPVSGRRVIEETNFTARVTNAGAAEVGFVLHGDGADVTLEAKSSDGLYYTALLTESELETLGHYADGSAELIVNGEPQQTIKLIYNIPEPERDSRLIDDFDDYYGVDGLLNKAWTLNSSTGAAGGSAGISLDEAVKYNGSASMKLDYSIGVGGYAGASVSRETDWTGSNALRLWMIPDGNDQRTVVQITANGKVYEAYLEEQADFKGRTDALLITIPFDEFAERDTAGNPKGGLVNDCKKVTGAGVWINAVENEAMVNGMVSGRVWYDDITAVTSEAEKITIESAGRRFNDVAADAWYYADVEYAAEHGIMSGVGDNMFAPETALTRAMLVQILYNMESRPESGESNFADVSVSDWFAGAVGWAASNGIVSGYSDTEFAPGDNITREQLAAILYRYARFKGYGISGGADLSKFADSYLVSAWAADALSWANASGLINGISDTELSPAGSATRAQSAAVIRRFCENVKTEQNY